MSFRGRIIGILLGLLVFKSPVAAFIGFMIGRYYDIGGFSDFIKKTQEKSNARNNENVQNIKARFLPFLFTSLGYLAKSDGRISEHEIRHAEEVMKHYGLDERSREQAIRWFKEGAAQEHNYDELLADFSRVVKHKQDVKKVLLELLISLAIADGNLHAMEEALLLKIAISLGVPEQVFRLLLSQLKGQKSYASSHKENALSEAYKVLGVKESDTIDVIKKSYRKLMSEHHPDKLIAQGVPEEAIRMATEKSQVIQSAYELIKKQRAV